ncbi:2OG-Fe(II) oxygenase [Rheinheimera nanhaiensis]|uniref:Fe2OG dioxygenase domain-containing protein n=1 Tax=Rheinheimera nanhaiensis E407-8 TaxID=562729 RepID=I1DZ89_9GAMM|nr:2OG-Fe(II) oxygenase family protein [Rheinheimera nanhaiensis]MDX5406441.1 2OG-Fe(II) oxygenase [Chromatiaceae bacterium]GAB59367.1 hypothetical protein RNAN_2369 [Rheinheimera nanhaiensis E407-8]
MQQHFFNLPTDTQALRQQLAANGVVQVNDFLRAEIVAQMEAELSVLPWDMAYIINGRGAKKPISEVMALSAQQQQQLFASITRQAAENQYAFCYDSYMLVTHYLQQTNPSSVFHHYVEQICHPQTVAFMRALTGNQTIVKADGQVSRYLPGHFLRSHDDNGAPVGQVRAAAYTIGLSRHWQPDWGGLLHLQENDGRIRQSLLPSFNTLTVFSVPQHHFVSQVANYCPAARYSIVGWFRSDAQ